MAVENDIYELPLAVADTVSELALMVGMNKRDIYTEMSRAKKEGLWCRFIKVPLDGDFDMPAFGKVKVKKETGPKKQRVIQVVNGQVIEYESAVKAAEANCVNVSTIRRWIKDRADWDYKERL